VVFGGSAFSLFEFCCDFVRVDRRDAWLYILPFPLTMIFIVEVNSEGNTVSGYLRSVKFKFKFDSTEVWVQLSLVHSNLFGELM